MKLLLDTIIFWDDQPVYYTIYEICTATYFGQLHDNPRRVDAASAFIFYRAQSEWKSAGMLSERQSYWLAETINTTGKYVTFNP